MFIIKFVKTIGEIPKDSIGILLNNIDGSVDFTRVFIPRYYTALSDKELPCYEMPKNNEIVYWYDLKNSDLNEEELKRIIDLKNEIEKKEKLFITHNGILIKTLGSFNINNYNK